MYHAVMLITKYQELSKSLGQGPLAEPLILIFKTELSSDWDSSSNNPTMRSEGERSIMVLLRIRPTQHLCR